MGGGLCPRLVTPTHGPSANETGSWGVESVAVGDGTGFTGVARAPHWGRREVEEGLEVQRGLQRLTMCAIVGALHAGGAVEDRVQKVSLLVLINA